MAPEGDGCVATRSCNINKDIGPATAYTIAHEIGHKYAPYFLTSASAIMSLSMMSSLPLLPSLGMLHDDDPNQPCPSGLYIMTSSLAASNNLNRWSVCSQQQLLQFFECVRPQCWLPFYLVLHTAPTPVLTTGHR